MEKTFEALLWFIDGLSEEDRRAVQKGLDVESLAIHVQGRRSRAIAVRGCPGENGLLFRKYKAA